MRDGVEPVGDGAAVGFGLFEETARYVAFRFVLRKRLDKDVNALMYGAAILCLILCSLLCFLAA